MLEPHGPGSRSGLPPMDASYPLLLDFLEWLAPSPRPYSQVMEAWRTSCPRLTIWEDAVKGRYIVRGRMPGCEAAVELTAEGRRLLNRSGRSPKLMG